MCALVVAEAGNGICYVKTGQNVWELFQSTMYKDSHNEEVNMIAEIWRPLGQFDLEPTGETKSCYADGSSVLEGCREIRITGAGMQMSLDRNLHLELVMEGKDADEANLTPFSFLDIEMKDGTVCHMLGKLPEGDEIIWVKDTGKCVGYSHQGEAVTGDAYLGAVIRGGGLDPYGTSAWEEIFAVAFDRFINVEEIAGVYLDGEKLPLK